MKDVFKEEDVTKVAELILSGVQDKIKEQISDAFYEETSSYLYEHYTNNKDKIEGELIASIAETYVKDPTNYKFNKLREKMFEENKGTLTRALTEEAIKEDIQNVIKQYTHRDYHFSWQWHDGIAQFIKNNWKLFEGNKRIEESFTRTLKQQEATIERLEEQLREIGELTH